MQITVTIPTRADIVHSTAFTISVVPKDSPNKWSKDALGSYADEQGVYVIHSNGQILYVGQTTGGENTFNRRLLCHFRETSNPDKKKYEFFAKQTKPVHIYFLELADIDKLVDPGSMTLSAKKKALIMEQLLIGIYEPIGNPSSKKQTPTTDPTVP